MKFSTRAAGLSAACACAALALFGAACNNSDLGSGGGGNVLVPPAASPGTSFALAAGLNQVQATPTDTLSPVAASLAGIQQFDEVYELTTPVDTDFSFSLIGLSSAIGASVEVAAHHLSEGGVAVSNSASSLSEAGITVEGPGMTFDGTWLSATGSGIARLTIRGNVDAEQVFGVRLFDGVDYTYIGVRVNIGVESPINVIPNGNPVPASILSTHDLYSSASYQFGLPALALTGDRYSICAYDGNRTDPYDYGITSRQRTWMQFDPATQAITGGEGNAGAADYGNWRNQELCGRDNVLAVAYSGYDLNYSNEQVTLDISLDRGATFTLSETLQAPTQYIWNPCQVQTAIAPDYTIAVTWWRSRYNPGIDRTVQEFVLVEVTPTAIGQFGTPTGYSVGTPVVIETSGTNGAMPLVTGMEYSSAGDLVLGYGYSERGDVIPGTASVAMTSYFKCAVRLAGGSVNTTLVDSETRAVPCDPSVSLIGSGTSMTIFYGYEKSDGVYIAHSVNAGQNFTNAATVGAAGAFGASVHARDQGGNTRVDVLFMDPQGYALALRNLHWDNYPSGTPVLQTVVDCVSVPTLAPGGYEGVRVTGLAWFGFDAITHGDNVVVAYDELTCNSWDYAYMYGGGMGWAAAGGGGVAGAGGGPQASPPVILLPGMTGTVPAPDSSHAHQLKLIVLD